MDEELNSKAAKNDNFWLQRETFLSNLDVAAQNQANFAKLYKEFVRLYEHSHVVEATSRIIRAKFIRALNIYHFL